MQKIRVVLAEDQSMLRGALAALLSIEPDIEVLGSFCDGEQARSRRKAPAGSFANRY